MTDDDDKATGPPPFANPLHIEDVAAPIIYVDTCFGGGPAYGDNIELTFATKILDHRHNPPVTLTKTNLRLISSRRSLQATAEFINKLLADLEAGIGSGGETPPANTTLN